MNIIVTTYGNLVHTHSMLRKLHVLGPWYLFYPIWICEINAVSCHVWLGSWVLQHWCFLSGKSVLFGSWWESSLPPMGFVPAAPVDRNSRPYSEWCRLPRFFVLLSTRTDRPVRWRCQGKIEGRMGRTVSQYGSRREINREAASLRGALVSL